MEIKTNKPDIVKTESGGFLNKNVDSLLAYKKQKADKNLLKLLDSRVIELEARLTALEDLINSKRE